MSERKIDLGMAHRFLKALAPDADKFTWQLFSDTKDWKQQVGARRARGGDPHAGVFLKSLDKAASSLSEKNENGVGVFVTINETRGTGRTLANFGRPRSLWADMDGAPTPKWPLPPSMIVESSPRKFHFYWLIDGDMPLSTWRGMMARIVDRYGADRAATDPVRVLRVPGFYHCKGRPVLVKLLVCNGRRYTGGELVKAFPPIARKPKRRSAGAVTPTNVDRDALRSALQHLAGVRHPKAKRGETYADDYDTWVLFGIAVKRALGDDGFVVWDEWSRTSSRYEGEAISRTKWESFDVDDRASKVTVGTIFGRAQRHGWSFGRFRARNAFESGLAAIRAERTAKADRVLA
jgi:hypothetical protein